MNEEESRAWGCDRHKPPVPIFACTVTFPRSIVPDTKVEFGQILCKECKQPPLVVELVTDRRPKKPSTIWTPPASTVQ